MLKYATKIDILITTPEDNSQSRPEPIDKSNQYLITIWSLSVLLVIAVAMLWLQRIYYKNGLLTQQDVDQFYKPKIVSGNERGKVNPNSDHFQFLAKYEIDPGKIEILNEIGRGQFGVVHAGLLEKQVAVAVKIPKFVCNKVEFLSVLSELKMHCYVGCHPNIVRFIGAYTKSIRLGKVFIVTEYCQKGSIQEYIRSLESDEKPDVNQLYVFANQIAAGMEHLAEKRIIRGDLATRNVLLTVDFTCKISDFGLLYEVNVYVKRGNEAMPWMWMAPESLRNREFTTKSDVWSYAVTLWEMFSMGHLLPYPGKCFTDGFIRELEYGIRLEKAKFASEEIHSKMLEC